MHNLWNCNLHFSHKILFGEVKTKGSALTAKCLRHALPISLLILRKNGLFCSLMTLQITWSLTSWVNVVNTRDVRQKFVYTTWWNASVWRNQVWNCFGFYSCSMTWSSHINERENNYKIDFRLFPLTSGMSRFPFASVRLYNSVCEESVFTSMS